MNKYICKHCGIIQERDSDKKWIESICGMSGDELVHLQKIESEETNE